LLKSREEGDISKYQHFESTIRRKNTVRKLERVTIMEPLPLAWKAEDHI
jgi:hypothetical protein